MGWEGGAEWQAAREPELGQAMGGEELRSGTPPAAVVRLSGSVRCQPVSHHPRPRCPFTWARPGLALGSPPHFLIPFSTAITF